MIEINNRVRVTNLRSLYFNREGEVKEIHQFSLSSGLKEKFYVLFPDGHKISFWGDELERVTK